MAEAWTVLDHAAEPEVARTTVTLSPVELQPQMLALAKRMQ